MTLPVQAEMPIQQNFVDATTVPVPNTQNSNSVRMEEAQQIHLAMLNTIQQTAYERKSILRIFMFNIYSANRFQNSQYAELFDSAIFYYTYLRHIGNHAALQTAVQDTIDTEFPKLIQMYPALTQYLSQQQIADVNVFREKYFVIGEDLKRWQGMTPPPQQYGGGYPAQTHPYGGGGYQPPQQQYGAPIQYGAPQRSPYVEVGDRPDTGMRVRVSSRVQEASRGTGYGHERRHEHTAPVEDNRPPVGSNRRLARGGPKTPPQEIPPMNRWQEMERAPAVSPSLKEAFGQGAASTDVDVSISFSRHKPAIVDGQTVVKRVGEKGALEYGVITKGMTMGEVLTGSYEEHETDQQALQQIRRNAGLHPKSVLDMQSNFGGIVNPKTITKKEDIDEEMIKSPEAVILKEQIAAFSIAHGEAFVSSYFKCMGIEDIDQRIYEYYLKLMSPVSATERDRELIKMLYNTGSLGAFMEELSAAADEMSPALWYTIHDRAVNAINKRLMSSMGYDGVLIMENFVDDYVEYFNILSNKYPAHVVDRFGNRVHRYIQDTLHMTDYTDGLCNDCNDGEGCVYDALYEVISITHVPWSSEEFKVSMTSEYNVLNKESSPEMHDALQSILRRTMTPDFSSNRRLLITADRRFIWIYPSDYSDETVIISNK